MSSVDFQNIQRRLDSLEMRDRRREETCVELEGENKALKDKVKALETFKAKVDLRESLKESSVFSARLVTAEDLSKVKDIPPFKDINKCIKVYKASVSFDATTCRYTAPIDGHYQMDLGLRQNEKNGHLEAMLMIGTSGKKATHAFIGTTVGAHRTCHKTMVLTLKRGDTVHAVVRRPAGKADIQWCAFHGFLISPTTDLIPPPREATPRSGSRARVTSPSAPPLNGFE